MHLHSYRDWVYLGEQKTITDFGYYWSSIYRGYCRICGRPKLRKLKK